MCSMSAPVASDTRSPFSASSGINACSAAAPRPATTRSAPASLRSRAPAWPAGTGAGFADGLLEVIDSGRRTATRKLVLLIALLDLCARHGGAGLRSAPARPSPCGPGS
jgi:hypothetical protein